MVENDDGSDHFFVSSDHEDQRYQNDNDLIRNHEKIDWA